MNFQASCIKQTDSLSSQNKVDVNKFTSSKNSQKANTNFVVTLPRPFFFWDITFFDELSEKFEHKEDFSVLKRWKIIYYCFACIEYGRS